MSDGVPLVELPVLGGAAGESWHGLLDLAEEVPDGWCLIGGFMVMLHCLERGAVPTRPTDDGDADCCATRSRAENALRHQGLWNRRRLANPDAPGPIAGQAGDGWTAGLAAATLGVPAKTVRRRARADGWRTETDRG